MSSLVAIPVRNRLDLTRLLVEALLSQAKEGDRLLVYDNGSTDGTREWFAGKEPGHRRWKSELVRMEAPGHTLHEMWNHAASMAVGLGCHLVLLNNDLELDGEPDWIDRLVQPLGDGWDALCPNYDNRADWRWVLPLHGVCGAKYDGTGGLAGFAFAISKHFLKPTGYRFPTEAKWWFGDTDLAFTLEKEGRHYGMVRDVRVTHVGGGSQTAKDHDLSAQCVADKAWFESKWGALCTTP